MINPTEKDERQYLESVKDLIKDTLEKTDNHLSDRAKELKDSKEYLFA